MFEEAFPYYLAMGMTYEQYWEQDSELVKFYRKAHEIRQEQVNHEAWLHGMYIYEAIADLVPVLRAFAKKGSKPRKYAEKPYEFVRPERKAVTDGGKRLSKADAEAKAKSDRIRERMMAAMQGNNKKIVEERMAKKIGAIGTEPSVPPNNKET